MQKRSMEKRKDTGTPIEGKKPPKTRRRNSRTDTSPSARSGEIDQEESEQISGFAVIKDKGANDVSLARSCKEKKKSAPSDNAYVPDFMGRQKARSSDFPISVDYLPELKGDKQGKAGRYDAMAEIISSSYQWNKGGKDRDAKALLGDSIFHMRGFGDIGVGLGIGPYGQDLCGSIARCRILRNR